MKRCKSSSEAVKAHEAGQCSSACPFWRGCYWGYVPEGMTRCSVCRVVEDVMSMAVVNGRNICNECLKGVK